MKLLEENTEASLHDFGLVNGFLVIMLKAQITKEKINNFSSVQSLSHNLGLKKKKFVL